MEATTVKIYPRTKSALDNFKVRDETYDEIINNLIQEVKTKHLKQQLIEAYKNMGKKELRILEEWELASKEL